MPLLTEPFYRGAGRTSHSGSGSAQSRGPGLALTASIATAHGTQLTLTANPECGLTAEFDPPVQAAQRS